MRHPVLLVWAWLFAVTAGSSLRDPANNDRVRKAAVPEAIRQYAGGNVGVGAGYSSDSQQVAPERCYSTNVSRIHSRQASLPTEISSTDLGRELGIDLHIDGSYGMFSGEAVAIYLRSIQDNDYTITLNFFLRATNKVSLRIAAGFRDEALTEYGKALYNDGPHDDFGLLCGDFYITSYEQGALFTIALVIKFSSSEAKIQFEKKAWLGTHDRSILRTFETLKSVAGAKHRITGSVTIQAFQMGGEPSQLSGILNKDSTGHYYASTCSFEAIDDCHKTAKDLFDYAAFDFPTQFSFQQNTGLTPLGIVSEHTCCPIQFRGLIPPVPLATPKVQKYRIELSRRLNENEYYQQKLYPFFNQGYPVKLDAAFMRNANLTLSKTINNKRVLMQPQRGALGCFNSPDKCESIKADIDSQLEEISDLQFLEDIKYTIPIEGGVFYNTGGGSEKSWDIIPDDPDQVIEVRSVSITDKSCSYCIVFVAGRENSDETCYTGEWINEQTAYVGSMNQNGHERQNVRLKKHLSPFFFEAYRP